MAMKWAQVWKKHESYSHAFCNSYYLDVPGDDDDTRAAFAYRLARFDLMHCADTVQYLCTTWRTSGNMSAFDKTGSYVFAPLSSTFTGFRPLVDVLPFRWRLRMNQTHPIGQMSHQSYMFAVGAANLFYGPRNGALFVGEPGLTTHFEDWPISEAGGIHTSIFSGVGNIPAGSHTAFKPIVSRVIGGVSIANGVRRARRFHISAALSVQDSVVSNAVAVSLAYQRAKEFLNLDLNDLYPSTVKVRTLDFLALVFGNFQKMAQIEKDAKGDPVNESGTWNSRFGTTHDAILNAKSQMKTEYEKDVESIGKIVPTTTIGGESYFSAMDADKLKEFCEKWMHRSGNFAAFDYLCPANSVFEMKDREGGYLAAFPDLEGVPF